VPTDGPEASSLTSCDAAVLAAVLAASTGSARSGRFAGSAATTAHPARTRTGRLMPNSAPPPPPAARRRTATPARTPTGTARTAAARVTGSSRAAVPAAPAARARLAGVPSSWDGFGALLAGAGERAPADALALAEAVQAGDRRETQVDFAGMWATPADRAAVRSQAVLRTLDEKGRLQLPVTVADKCQVSAERDGAVVTVFLPGSTDRPRPDYAAASLPLYPGGRLTLSTGVRRQAGIPDRADVLAVLDPERLTVTLTAASRIDAAISDAFDALRRTPDGARTAGPAGPAADAADVADLPALTGTDGTQDGLPGRLRSVG
jgi:hypothetical protein